MAQKLEIGPGVSRLGDEWVTVDCVPRAEVVDFVCQWGEEPFPFADGAFEQVYASHVLEHIPWYRTVDALREVFRVLRPGGLVELHVPDLDVLMAAVQGRQPLDTHAEDRLNRDLHWMHWVSERLFHRDPEEQWHRACFNAAHLSWCLEQAGFEAATRVLRERNGDHGVINLGMLAAKPAVSDETPSLLVELRGLPACESRYVQSTDNCGVFHCRHPRVRVHEGHLSRAVCKSCSYAGEPAPALQLVSLN